MNNKNNIGIAKAFSLISQIGIHMIVPIIICLFVGKWLDSKFSTKYIFLIIFLILGVLSSFRNLYVLVIKNYSKESKQQIYDNMTTNFKQNSEGGTDDENI